MSFVFRLDAALQQRARQEREAQLSLAHALAAYQEAVTALRERSHGCEEARAEVDAQSLDVDGQRRMNMLYYLDRMEGVVQSQTASVETCRQEVVRAREVLMAAAQRRRALERLRERRAAEYRAAEERRSERALDELITLRYGATSRGRQDG